MNRYNMGNCYKAGRYVNNYSININCSINKSRVIPKNNYNILRNNQNRNPSSLPKIDNKWQKNNNIKTSISGIKNNNLQNNNKSIKFFLKTNDERIKEAGNLQQIRERKNHLIANNYLCQNDKKVTFNDGNLYNKFDNNNILYKDIPQNTNNTCYNVLENLLKYLLNIEGAKNYYFNLIKYNNDKINSSIKLSDLVENDFNRQKLKNIIQLFGLNNKNNVPNLLVEFFTSISKRGENNNISNSSDRLLNRNKLNENIINKLFLGCYQLISLINSNYNYSYENYLYNYYILLKPEIIDNQKHDISLLDFIYLYFNKRQDSKKMKIYEPPEILIILIEDYGQSKIKIKFNKFLGLTNLVSSNYEPSTCYELDTISYSKGNFNVIKNYNDNNFYRDENYIYKSQIDNENDYYVLFYTKKNNKKNDEVKNAVNNEDRNTTSKCKIRGKTNEKNRLNPGENMQSHYDRNKKASVEKNLQNNQLNVLRKESNIDLNKEKNSNKIEPKGLVNFGLNCYMNSLLQCLYYIKELREEFIMKKNDYRKDQNVCKAFAEVMYRLKYENANYSDAKEIKNIMGEKNNLFKGCKAADVKDLFINLIDAFIGELSKDDDNESIYNEPNYTDKVEMFQEAEREVDENIIINKLFLGYYESDYQCPINKNIHIYSFQEQTFLLFELLLISKYYRTANLTLKECFEFYFSREDKISSFFCSKCRKTHKNNYIEKIYRLPEILVIALDRGYGKAFQGKVEFNIELNLNKDLNNCIDKDNKENNKNIFYKLICISTHSGSSSAGGHYTACCLTDNGKYYYFSDTYVHEIKEKHLYDDEPYLLFYKKINDNTNNSDTYNRIYKKRYLM